MTVTQLPPGLPDPLGAAEVVLVASSTCTACVQAQDLLEKISREYGLSSGLAMIEDYPVLAQEHGQSIPVLVIDGVPRDFWVIHEPRVRRLLDERAAV